MEVQKFSQEIVVLIDTLIATPEGQRLIQERWQYAKELAESKAKADSKAAEEVRKASPPPLEGWDCWVCGWKGDRPGSQWSRDHCPGCHCLHGLRCAPGAWQPFRR